MNIKELKSLIEQEADRKGVTVPQLQQQLGKATLIAELAKLSNDQSKMIGLEDKRMTLIEYLKERFNYLKLQWELTTGTYVPKNVYLKDSEFRRNLCE